MDKLEYIAGVGICVLIAGVLTLISTPFVVVAIEIVIGFYQSIGSGF